MSCMEGWESMGDPTPWGMGEGEGEVLTVVET